MRTIIVAIALTINDDAPTPAGVVDIDAFEWYTTNYVGEANVIAVLDREHPENNVEAQLFTDYTPCSPCDCGVP